MQQVTPLEVLLKRDRWLVTAGLLAVAGLAWAYIVYLSQDMGAMMVPLNQDWSGRDFAFQFTMWSIMMLAMMLPSAAPMILVFSTVQRKRREEQRPYVPVTLFVAGYLVAWASFASVATIGQWGLHQATLLSPMMESTNAVLGGCLLLAAGLFQLTPLKYACLSQCRTPLGFIMTEWRDGRGGALKMGLKHGTYCVGCCWVLMALLFVTGVMNLVWVAIIAGFILLEKVAPRGKWVSWVSAPALFALAGWSFVGGLT